MRLAALAHLDQFLGDVIGDSLDARTWAESAGRELALAGG